MTAATKQGYYELVEPRTLFNSIVPVILGIMYSWYNYRYLRLGPTIAMAIATIVLQLFMNVNDGYWDYRREKAAKTGDHQKNPIGKYHLAVKHVALLVIVLFAISAIAAISIGLQTNLYVWIIGIICYAIAISYSTGSHTISSGPFGEIAAELAMGLGIYLVMVYINVCPIIDFNWTFLGQIVLAAAIPEICNFTLMLGNNLCDHDADIANGRHTLVSFIGIKGGLWLFVFNYILGYALTIWAVLIHVLPWSVLLIVLVLPRIVSNLQQLWQVQSKKTTFPKVVQNTQLLFLSEAIGFLLGIIFNL